MDQNKPESRTPAEPSIPLTAIGEALARAQKEASASPTEPKPDLRKKRGPYKSNKPKTNTPSPADDMLKSIGNMTSEVPKDPPAPSSPTGWPDIERRLRDREEREAMSKVASELKFLSNRVEEGLAQISEKSEYVSSMAESVAQSEQEVKRLAEDLKETKAEVKANNKVKWIVRGLGLLAALAGATTVVMTNRRITQRDQEHYDRIMSRKTEADLNNPSTGENNGY